MPPRRRRDTSLDDAPNPEFDPKTAADSTLRHLHRPSNLEPSELRNAQRSIKMAFPRCNVTVVTAKGFDENSACQDPANVQPNWWEHCPHSPYVHRVHFSEQVPVLGEKCHTCGQYASLHTPEPACVQCSGLVDSHTDRDHDFAINDNWHEFVPSGRMVIVEQRTETWFEDVPNLGQVFLSRRINSGYGVVQAMELKGWKMPEDVGFLPFCQFRNCWSQDISYRNPRVGDFCSETQARYMAADLRGVRLEVFDGEKRAEQLAGMVLG